MAQVFARYAKDMLEKQTYPEVRRGPNAPPEPPYDVTAWSLGMLLGVDTVFVNKPLPAIKMTKIDGLPKMPGDVTGSGSRFAFDYKGPDTAIAINRLLKDGARLAFDGPSRVAVAGVSRGKVEQVAKDFGLAVKASEPRRTSRTPDPDQNRPNGPGPKDPGRRSTHRASRCISRGPAATWTKAGRGGCWSSTSSTSRSIHNADIRAGKLRQKFDAIIIADQNARDIVDGYDAPTHPP